MGELWMMRVVNQQRLVQEEMSQEIERLGCRTEMELISVTW